MAQRLCIYAVVFSVSIISTAVAEEMRSLESKECIASVLFRGTPFSNRPDTYLVFAVWEDGTVVFSTERVDGGPPMFTGKVDTENVKQLVEKLSSSGVFSDEFSDRHSYGPDFPYTEIRLTNGSTVRKLSSWHEIVEESRGVVTDSGILLGNPGSKVAELTSTTQEYLVFRLIWSEIRHELDLLRPKDAVPVDGKLIYKDRTRHWQPKPLAP